MKSDKIDVERVFERLERGQRPGNVTLQRAIFDLLVARDRTRRDLVVALDRARTTIYDNLVVMQRHGIVKRYKARVPLRRGRPKTYWTVDEEGVARL